jgi:hypothetical protein
VFQVLFCCFVFSLAMSVQADKSLLLVVWFLLSFVFVRGIGPRQIFIRVESCYD